MQTSSENAKDTNNFFGLNPADPQDWITVALSGIVLYETVGIVKDVIAGISKASGN
jgi:hypothetical protein